MDSRSFHRGPDVCSHRWLLLNTAMWARYFRQGGLTQKVTGAQAAAFGRGLWECVREGGELTRDRAAVSGREVTVEGPPLSLK